MRSPDAFFTRYGLWLLLAFLATLPVLVIGSIGGVASNSNDVRQWLPGSFEVTRTYEQFVDHFGTDEIAVVSWQGCTIDDPRIDQLAQMLLKPAQKDRPAYFQRVISGAAMVEQLTSPPFHFDRDVAIDRLTGTVIGPDQQTTCVIAVVSPLGESDRPGAMGRIFDVAQACGIPSAELHLGGPTIDGATMDIESQRSMYELAALAALVSFLIAWRVQRSLHLALIVLVAALYNTAAAMAVLYFTGGNMNLAMVMMPVLVFVLAISAAVHLTNYYRDAVAATGIRDAAEQAVKAAWFPCAVAALTTAVGLASLMTSQIVPVHDFGFYSAVGILCGIPVGLLLIPLGLAWWPPKEARQQATPSSRAHHQDRWSGPAADLICRHSGPLTAVCLAAMAAIGLGLGWVETTVKLQHRFQPSSRIMEDYAWLERHVGSLVPVELVVRLPEDEQFTSSQRVELLRQIEDRLAKLSGVSGTLSAATFIPTPRRIGSAVAVGARVIKDRRIERNFPEFVSSHLLHLEGTDQLWRVSARVEALNNIDYGVFMQGVREAIDPLVANTTAAAGEVTYTGVIPLLYTAQRQLLNDLIESFLLAFAIIAIVVMVTLRGVRVGLLAMIPNVFPPVIVFGAMGWLGWLVDIGAVMTASVALGIAVDDTFHFLTWFRRGLNSGLSRHDAIQHAYRHCGGAMARTTLICGMGLMVMAFSNFLPTVRFAWMMVAMLSAALLGDLVLLPSLLAGPIGRWAIARADRTTASAVPRPASHRAHKPLTEQTA